VALGPRVMGDSDGLIRRAAGRRTHQLDAFVEEYRPPSSNPRPPHEEQARRRSSPSATTLLRAAEPRHVMQRVWFEEPSSAVVADETSRAGLLLGEASRVTSRAVRYSRRTASAGCVRRPVGTSNEPIGVSHARRGPRPQQLVQAAKVAPAAASGAGRSDGFQRGPLLDPRRPPGPRGAGRGGKQRSISSHNRSCTSCCCFVLGTTTQDRRSGTQDRVATHPVLRPGLAASLIVRRCDQDTDRPAPAATGCGRRPAAQR